MKWSHSRNGMSATLLPMGFTQRSLPRRRERSGGMRRTSALILAFLTGIGALVAWAAPVEAASPSAGRLTLQVRLDATNVVVGTPISGTAIVKNGTSKSVPSTSCPENWVEVGLVGHGAKFTAFSGNLCFSKRVLKPHSTQTFPVTVETTYDGCGGPAAPRCPHDGMPLLPLGSYSVDIVNVGLPKSIHTLPTKKVTLVNATTGQSHGPIGGSILIQAYGCQTVAPQRPISVVLDRGVRVIARRRRLGVTQQMIVGVSPGVYMIHSNARPVHPVRVFNGVQTFATIIPRCS
jgi:hypothetical protein